MYKTSYSHLFILQWATTSHLTSDDIIFTHQIYNTRSLQRKTMSLYWHVFLLRNIKLVEYRKGRTVPLDQLHSLCNERFKRTLLLRYHCHIHNPNKHSYLLPHPTEFTVTVRHSPTVVLSKTWIHTKVFHLLHFRHLPGTRRYKKALRIPPSYLHCSSTTDFMKLRILDGWHRQDRTPTLYFSALSPFCQKLVKNSTNDTLFPLLFSFHALNLRCDLIIIIFTSP